MKMKKKYVVILILSLLFIGLGTIAFNAFKPRRISEDPSGDFNDPEFQNKIIEKPEDGNALDYNLKDNLFIAMGVLKDKNNYQVATTGTTSAKVGIINVTQALKSSKQVRNGEVLYISISHGMKPVAKQLYVTSNNYIVREASSITSLDDVVWEDKPTNYSRDDFLTLFGNLFFDFSQYILNDTSVLEADLISKDNNEIKVKYTLDTTYSPINYRREIKTMSGSKDLPEFISVALTVTMNKDWEILKVESEESYYVNVFGSIKTTGKLESIFAYDDIEIADRDYFSKYFGKETESIIEKEKTSLDYLMALTSPLVNSPYDINFESIILVNDHKMNLNGAINLNDMKLAINLDNYLFLELENDQWLVKYDEVTGFVTKETIKDVLDIDIDQDLLQKLMSPEKMGAIEEKLSHDIIGDIVYITIKFDFGTIDIQGNLKDNTIVNITGQLNVLNQIIDIKLNIVKPKTVEPINKDNLIDLNPIFKEIYQMVKSPRFKVKLDYFTLENDLLDIALDGELYANLSEGLNLDGYINVYLGDKAYQIKLTVIGDEIYLSAFDFFKVKVTFNEIPEVLSLFKEWFNLDFNIDDLQTFSELTLNKELFNSLAQTKLRYVDNSLIVSLFIEDEFLPFDITYQNKQIKIILPENANLTIDHSDEDKEIRRPSDTFIEFSSIKDKKELIKALIEFVQKEQYQIDVNFIKDKLELSAFAYLELKPHLNLYLDGTIKYENVLAEFKVSLNDNIIKVKAGNIEIELTTDEVLQLLSDNGISIPTLTNIDFSKVLDLLSKIVFRNDSLSLDLLDHKLSYHLDNRTKFIISGQQLNAAITGLNQKVEVEPLILEKPLRKAEIDELLILKDNILGLFTQTKARYDITGLVTDKYQISGNIKLDTSHTQLNVDINLQVVDLTPEGRTHDISLLSLNGMTYITYNGLQIYATTEEINKTIKTILQVMGLENPILDSILDVTIDGFENVFAPYLKEGKPIYILDYLKDISVTEGQLEIRLNRDKLYNHVVDTDAVITLVQTSAQLNEIKIKDFYVNEEDKLNFSIISNSEDFDLVAPVDLNGYHHLSGIDKLLNQFFKTSELKNYEISGILNIKFLNFVGINIKNFNLKVVLDENLTPSFVGTYTVPYFPLVTNNKTDVSIYLKDGMIHAKMIKYSLFSNETKHYKWTQSEFEENLVENILFLLNVHNSVKNSVLDAIKRNEEHVILPEKILVSYNHYNDQHFKISLSGEGLTGDSNLDNLNITIKSNEDGYLNKFLIDLVAIKIVDIKGDFGLINIGQQIIIDYPDFEGKPNSW